MPGVLARPSWLFLAAAYVGCSGGMSDGDPRHRSISDSERRAIEAEPGDWGATGEIGPITRLSVDSFSVDFDGITHYVSLREDGILTEGFDDLTGVKLLHLYQEVGSGEPGVDFLGAAQAGLVEGGDGAAVHHVRSSVSVRPTHRAVKARRPPR